MAYNLYQVQMSNAWAEVGLQERIRAFTFGGRGTMVTGVEYSFLQRINKEMAQAEKFWNQHIQQLEKSGPGPRIGVPPSEVLVADAHEVGSYAGSGHARSVAPTGFTSKTAVSMRERVIALGFPAAILRKKLHACESVSACFSFLSKPYTCHVYMSHSLIMPPGMALIREMLSSC